MTFSELIAVLKGHPPDLRVVVNGYENGFDPQDSPVDPNSGAAPHDRDAAHRPDHKEKLSLTHVMALAARPTMRSKTPCAD